MSFRPAVDCGGVGVADGPNVAVADIVIRAASTATSSLLFSALIAPRSSLANDFCRYGVIAFRPTYRHETSPVVTPDQRETSPRHIIGAVKHAHNAIYSRQIRIQSHPSQTIRRQEGGPDRRSMPDTPRGRHRG